MTDDQFKLLLRHLQKAADLAKEDSARVMDVAHKLSYQVRTAEARTHEAEAEAAHFRERATRAEGWMLRIREEVEQTFFQK
jgi:aspartate carbamoyltransferase catalytic subunit